MSKQTVAQMRAKHALGRITSYQTVYQTEEDKQKRFNSYTASFGPMILMSGFGQACAFYVANKKTEHKDVLDAVEAWLQEKGRPFHGQNGNIIACITSSDSSTYRLAQIETLAYLDWLKKFGKAFLKSEEGDAL